MNNTVVYPGIQNIEFINSTILFVHLTNDRVFIVPLDKFPVIKDLSSEQKKEFEIIDDKYLSFLAIDEIYSIEELIGLSNYS
jgi:succinate dehydrogenase/fumarate reductase-like Fe-S protein